jgi:hypothetical protein
VLVESIKTGAKMLTPIVSFADPLALLGALAVVESSFGEFNVPRFERAYAKEGHLFNYDQLQRYKKWGAWACCSYSSFQIMYPVACELGFDSEPWRRSPADLWNDDIAVLWVVEYIKRRCVARGVKTVEEFADCYNSGYHKDKNVPYEYIKEFRTAYGSVVSKYNLKKEESCNS